MGTMSPRPSAMEDGGEGGVKGDLDPPNPEMLPRREVVSGIGGEEVFTWHE